MDIRNKTIVVTGAGRGIGRAIALRLAQNGSDIALFDISQTDLNETNALCVKHAVRVRSYLVNVADEGQVTDAMKRVSEDFGRLDGLINNAGILRDNLLVKVKGGVIVGRMSMDEWISVISVNLGGVFLCGREAAAHMIEFGQGGVIVNISSISRVGNAGQSNYSAAKAGVHSLSVVWAQELARHKIRVGSIAPGYIHTEILDSMRPELFDKLTASVPVKRLGVPTEIAHAVLFILENEFFTGRCIEVDGGLRF